MMFRRRALPLTAAGLVAVTAVLVGCGEDAPPLDVATSPRLKVVATEMAYSPAKVAVEAGTYELYCSLPGHKEAGMAGVLEVR